MNDEAFQRASHRQLRGIGVPYQSDEALRTFVYDFLAGHVFIDRSVTDPNIMPLVFMPIAFGCFDGWSEDDMGEIGVIYEYISKAGPKCINGCPIFMSLRMLHRDDWERCRKAILREQERREEIEV